MTLKICGRIDDVPVYKGASSSLLIKDEKKGLFHGEDGLNDIYENKPTLDLVQKKHAVEAMKDVIDQYPNEVVILSIAPLTNIALLYKLFPDISRKIKSIYIMGGNHLGVGNTTKHAEFNFWHDPEAAHIVINEGKCALYIFPWEVCVDASNLIPFDDWRINTLSNNQNSYSKFLDPIEKIAYKKYTTWMPCDCFSVACFIIPEIIKREERHHVSIELGGFHCRAMMVIDHLRDSEPNATIIKEIDVDLFKKFMLWVCHHNESFY